MMKRLLTSLLVSLVSIGSFAAPAAVAQEEAAPPQFLNVFTAHTKLGHQAQYEKVVTTLWASMKAVGGNFPIFASQSVSNPGDYSFVTPMSSMADMDAQGEVFGKAFAHAGPALAELGSYSNGNTSQIIAPRPDLAYAPEDPRLADGEGMFAHITYLYVQPPNAPAVEAAIKSFADLSRKHGIPNGFNVYQGTTGEGPVYMIRALGKSQSDYFTQVEMTEQKLGAEGAAIRDNVGPMLKRIEITSGFGRPDLSYQPE